jgi:hypothetical protein
MGHPAAWVCVALGLFFAFIIVRTSDWYRELTNPVGYWTEKVTRRTELLDEYRADLIKCTEELKRLDQSASRDLWIRQKDLEGMSRTAAIGDYESYLENSKFACRVARDFIPGAEEDLKTARDKLRQLSR